MNIYLTILFYAALVFPFGAAADLRRESNVNRTEKTGDQNPAADKPPMFVLQIGISNYKYQRKLSGVTDVLAMRDVLTGDAYKIPPGNIHTLCDDGTYKKEDGTTGKCDGAATKDNIVKEFETHLIAKAREYNLKNNGKQAVVLFEFSGHGSQVPDQPNGDEKDDHKDETLVTWDSQDAPGKNFDITDDEIYDLTSRLEPYTNNIVYILDSCTSGSGTRGADDVRGLPARKTVPVPMKSSGQNASRGGADEKKTATDEAQTDMLPPSSSYIVLSAAKAGELAQQKNIFECATCPKKLASYGYLTYYLMRELQSATPATSYGDMMENIRRNISTDTSSVQNPQIEGDENLRVFGELSQVKNPGIKISDAKNNQIILEAGALQGIAAGTIFDIYSGDKDEKIAVARVSKVLSPSQSVAEVIPNRTADNAAARAVSTEMHDRAVLIAPDLGAARLNILLDGEDAAKLNETDKDLIKTLRGEFTPKLNETDAPGGVALVAGKWNEQPARWDAALLKDSFKKVFPDASRAVPIGVDAKGEKIFPPDDRQIFYLAGRDFTPLYGFYVEADRTDTAGLIEDAILHLARQRAVKAIANNKSALRGKIRIEPFLTVSPTCPDRRDIVAEKKPLVLNKTKTGYEINQKVRFGLDVSNDSSADLYITIIDIANDGAIKIFAPRNIDGEKDGLKLAPHQTKTFFGDDICSLWRTSAPKGTEIFKVIASTAKTPRKAFEFLQQTGLRSRDPESAAKLTNFADWTTAEINFEISSTQEKP